MPFGITSLKSHASRLCIVKKTMSKVNFKPSKQLLEASELVLATIAYVQTIEPVLIAIERKILEEGNYFSEEQKIRKDVLKPFRITEPSMSYLLSDADFNEYQIKYRKAFIAEGFSAPEGQCPLLIAEGWEREARRAMRLATVSFTKINFDGYIPLNKLKQIDELTLQLVGPFIDKESAIKKFHSDKGLQS
jgi:hypothetical protein